MKIVSKISTLPLPAQVGVWTIIGKIAWEIVAWGIGKMLDRATESPWSFIEIVSNYSDYLVPVAIGLLLSLPLQMWANRERQYVIRTFSRQTGKGGPVDRDDLTVAGLIIDPKKKLTDVKIYIQTAIMASGWSSKPPSWGDLTPRKEIHAEPTIVKGDKREIKLIERTWDLDKPVVCSDIDFGAPDSSCWSYRLLRIELVSNEVSEIRDLALFMPGYSVIMIVDASSVPMTRSNWSGPITISDPRIEV